jgi:hypothetical protein
MASGTRISPLSETAILARLVGLDEEDLPVAAAEAWLKVRFEEHDLDRIHELLTGNQADALTPAEREELETYLRVSSFLDLMHAKAHRSLTHHA